MSSLDKALLILKLFSLERPVLGVTEVAQELGLPKSSASRLMKAMAESGLLEQEDGRRGYMPGILAFQLGNLYQRHLAILDLVDEAVTTLVRRFGLTGYIGVLIGTDVVLIAVRQGSYPIRLVLEKGTRIPAHVTAIGMALLSRRSDQALRQLYPATVSYDETQVVTSPDEIVAQAASVREMGYAAIEGNTFPGFNAVAAAVESVSERQSIGFSLSYPQELLAESDLQEIVQALVSTAHQVGVRTADPYWLARKSWKEEGGIGPDGTIRSGKASSISGRQTTRLAGYP